MLTKAQAYTIATRAESAWQAELERVFGRNACEVRYTDQAHGKPGSRLAALHRRYVEARNLWALYWLGVPIGWYGVPRISRWPRKAAIVVERPRDALKLGVASRGLA